MKIFKRILLILLIVVILGGGIYLWQALPIISGYGAKNLCSCVFISGRNPQDVIDEDLDFSLVKLGSYKVNFDDSSATGTVIGLGKQKAIYRSGLGCTLIAGIEESELRSKDIPDLEKNKFQNDTLEWPLGERFSDSIPVSVDQTALGLIVTAAFNDTLYQNPSGTRGIVIVKDGKLIAEKYKPPFNAETPQLGWSMTKSITNGLIGILVQKEMLSVDQDSLLKNWKGTPRENITLNDLLRMSSGLEWWEFYGGVSSATKMLYKSYNTGEYAAEQPLETNPGSKWSYSSGTTNILSLILKRQLPLNEYIRLPHTELFNKLNMKSAVLEPDASGTYVGSSYMYATPRDWAKYGLLMLNDGMWNGERILPEGWVDYSSSLTEGSSGEYGAHFWLNKGNSRLPDVPENVIIMSGFQGQRVYILPDQKMVIVRLGFDPDKRFDFNLFIKNVLTTIN